MESQVIKIMGGETTLIGKEIPEEFLTSKEQDVWTMTDAILSSIGGLPEAVSAIRLVEVIQYIGRTEFMAGCYYPTSKEIFISRVTLNKSEDFIGVLLHEIAHAITGAKDNTHEFELGLTKLLGRIGSSLISATNNKPAAETPIQSSNFLNYGYASLRCANCMSTDFERNNDLSYIRCKNCGKEYFGGYNELVLDNRKYIEQHGDSIYRQDVFKSITDIKPLLLFGVALEGDITALMQSLFSAGLITGIESHADSIESIQFSHSIPELPSGTISLIPQENGIISEAIIILNDSTNDSFNKAYSCLTKEYGRYSSHIKKGHYAWHLNAGRITLLIKNNQIQITFKNKMHNDTNSDHLASASLEPTTKNATHLNYFGVPLTGTQDEFMSALANAGIIAKESELSKLVRHQHPSDIITLWDNDSFLGFEGGLCFIFFSSIGQAKRIMWTFPSLGGYDTVMEIVHKIIPFYKDYTCGRLTLLDVPGGKIHVFDSENKEYGIIVEFTDTINSLIDEKIGN